MDKTCIDVPQTSRGGSAGVHVTRNKRKSVDHAEDVLSDNSLANKVCNFPPVKR